MLAGATAGIAEHVAMFPVDTVKTRMQALGHPGQRVRPLTCCCNCLSASIRLSLASFLQWCQATNAQPSLLA